MTACARLECIASRHILPLPASGHNHGRQCPVTESLAADGPGLGPDDWRGHSRAPFIDIETYNRGEAPIDVAALEVKPCWIGVNMAQRFDLCVIVVASRDG